ncbi:TPA: hypothetical protein ACF3I9_004410 [Klebsiella aerogenes]
MANQVLTPETMQELRRGNEVNYQGWKILDRWAVNFPDELKQLEALGFPILFHYLSLQQEEELEAILNNQDKSLAEHEVLELNGINMQVPGIS